MSDPEPGAESDEVTYPLRTVVKLTGLSPELLRAWEKRHGAVRPIRTPGGTRRYRASDLERLRLLKAAVDAGQRIGRVARLGTEALREQGLRLEPLRDERTLGPVLAALDGLDGPEVQRLLSIELSTLGPVRFARRCALPLVREIGDRWEQGRLGVASEHLASSVLRTLLGAALQPTATALLGPRILFATPEGERHELGLLMAALAAMGAGGNPLYLGPEVPAGDLVASARRSGAAAVAIGIVTLPAPDAERALQAVRAGLPAAVAVWIGGAGARRIAVPDGVERLEDLEALEHRVALLGSR